MIRATCATALASALPLGEEGFAVFFCGLNKQPTCINGFKDAVMGADEVRELHNRHPGPLVAFATGSASGCDVLDLDAKHPDAARWWADNRDHIPPTRAHRSRSGGIHLMFIHAEGIRNTASRLARGVDTRGDGGYAIHWPSVGLPVLCDAPITPWPRWLHDALAERREAPHMRGIASVEIDQRWLAGLVRLVAAAPEGQRNSTLFWAACRIAERYGDRDFAADVLVAAAQHAGLPTIEAQRTVRSGLGHAER